MQPHAWLQAALADLAARGRPDVRAPLEALARATERLRAADWNEDASGAGEAAASSATARDDTGPPSAR